MSAAVLDRPSLVLVSLPRPVHGASCDVCFGTGQIFAKPGVLVPCPNGCPGGFTAAALAPSAGSVCSVGCLECMHDCGGVGCGCTCCCSYLPAVAEDR